MNSIGIVGGGIAGLHLGLYLRHHGITCTIYGDQTPEAIAKGRIQNTVAHHNTTLERERQIGIDFWDAARYGYFCHWHYFGFETPLHFRGDFSDPSLSIDYRLLLPRLMEEYLRRGGKLDLGRSFEPADVVRVSERHDLIVVCSGRGSLAKMFPRIDALSPYDRPQRQLCAGFYRGVARSQPVGVYWSVWPGAGEVLELPITWREGPVTAMLFECIPGGPQDVFRDLDYEQNPKEFDQTVLQLFENHYPKTYERINTSEFGLTGPLELLKGAVTPVVREDYIEFGNGKFALALGDAHVVVDPIVGQGANAASYSAFVVGEAIVGDYVYDRLFCERVAHRRAERLQGLAAWVNMTLAPPTQNLIDLVGAMSQNQSICDEFTRNFNAPERQWEILATPERTHAFLRSRLAR
jgi:2-polyprenyl-6-methoxyphenol hydroxylase-like FAD-dependent oxidoreductase